MSTVNLQWDWNLLQWIQWVNGGQPEGDFPLGWTDKPILQPGNKHIYVSQSEGNDSNDGLTEQTPKQTTAAAISIMIAGDHIRPKAGDTWLNNKMNVVAGANSLAVTAIYPYGTGDRPNFRVGNTTKFLDSARSHIWFFGLEITNRIYDPSDPDHDPLNDGAFYALISIVDTAQDAFNENILFEDCKFNYLEMVIQGRAQNNSWMQDIRLNRNIWTGAYKFGSTTSSSKKPSNLYVEAVQSGFVATENVWDTGGWNRTVAGAGANIFNHNVYSQAENGLYQGDDAIYYNNWCTRASSMGLMIRQGGTVLDNFIGKCAVGIAFGYTSSDVREGAKCYAIRNVVNEVEAVYKGATLADEQATNNRSGALWTIRIDPTPNVPDVRVEENVVSIIGDEWYDNIPSPQTDAIDLNGAGVAVNNAEYKIDPPNQGEDQGYPNPDTVLANFYNDNIAGAVRQDLIDNGYIEAGDAVAGYDTFDTFMNIVLNRKAGQWDYRVSANAINNYFRLRFGMNSYPVSNVIP